jgi:hypothetical protein
MMGAWMVALLATSCSLGSSAEAGSINLYLEVDDSQLTVGVDSMTITVTVRNVGYAPVTLTGPSDCLLYVEVLSSQGTVVWHQSKVGCTGSTVTEELVAGVDKIQSFIWKGYNFEGGVLSPGPYYIRGVARVTGASYTGPLLSVALD